MSYRVRIKEGVNRPKHQDIPLYAQMVKVRNGIAECNTIVERDFLLKVGFENVPDDEEKIVQEIL